MEFSIRWTYTFSLLLKPKLTLSQSKEPQRKSWKLEIINRKGSQNILFSSFLLSFLHPTLWKNTWQAQEGRCPAKSGGWLHKRGLRKQVNMYYIIGPRFLLVAKKKYRKLVLRINIKVNVYIHIRVYMWIPMYMHVDTFVHIYIAVYWEVLGVTP